MFRALYENANVVCWVFVSLLLLCILVYFLVGAITKKYRITLKLLLIGEEYTFALISSVFIFMTLSFVLALVAWLLVFFLMNYIFRNNRRLVSYIAYFEKNKTDLNRRQLRSFTQMNPSITSTRITLWIKDFRCLRKETLYKLDSDIHISKVKPKCKLLPFSIFALGTIGISVTLLAYGYLVEDNSSFLMLLVENYAILSCVLFALYVLLYVSSVGNIFHYMYGNKKLFKILFAVFSVIMYIGVTIISINV